MEKPRIIIALLAGIAALGMWFIADRHNKKTEETVREMMEGPQWNGEKIQKLLADSETLWKEAEAALRAHQHHRAWELQQKAESILSKHAEFHSSKEVKPGVTFQQWINERKRNLDGTAAAELDRVLEQLKQGGISVEEAEYFARNLFPTIEKKYFAQRQAVAAIRARLAPRWFRVYFSWENPNYTPFLKQILRQKWDDRYGIQLVFGRSLEKIEEKATWKEICIQINVENARYHFTSKKFFAHHRAPEIPERVSVVFKLAESYPVPTTWSQLPVFNAYVDAPDTVYMRLNDSGFESEVEKLEREHSEKLATQIKKQFEKLPKFEIYPGADPTTLTMVKNGRVDMDAARALGYLDREKIAREITTLQGSKDATLIPDICKLVVEMNLETMAPWLVENLAQADLHTQKEALHALKQKPWFGDFAPIFALIDHSHDQIQSDAVWALHGHFHDEKPFASLARVIENTNQLQRAEYANFFLREIPREKLAQFSRWLADNDANFSTRVFDAIGNVDKELAAQVTVEKFDQMNPKLQSRMLDAFRQNRQPPDTQGIAILKKAATQAQNPELSLSAILTLVEFAWTPHVWDALQELQDVPTQVDPNDLKYRIQEALVGNVKRVYPDRAKEFLTRTIMKAQEQLRTETATTNSPSTFKRTWNSTESLRDRAINELLGMDIAKEDTVRLLAQMVQENKSDNRLFRTVLMNLKQFSSLRKGWNWDQPELKNLVSSGISSTDKQMRDFSYEIAGVALQKGQTEYEGLLTQALEQETESNLRATIQRHLKTAKNTTAKSAKPKL